MKRVALYLRVSTDLQAANDNNSLDIQESRLRGAVAARGPNHTIMGVFREEGFSGKNTDRPELGRMMTAAIAGEIDLIIVTKIDRFSRSILDFHRMYEELKERGVDLQSLDNQFDTTTAQGRAFLNMILVFAQFEREQTSERTQKAKEERTRQGLWTGGHPILGYDKGKDDRLKVNESEVPVVRACFDQMLELRGAPAVARWLNDQGHRQKKYISRRKQGPTGGKPFSASVVRTMLRNQVYLGNLTYKAEVIKDTHEPIIDPTTFARVADVLNANAGNRRAPSPESSKRAYLLVGLARCECGYAMSPHPAGPKEKLYHYYRCVGLQKHKVEGYTCAVGQVAAEQLEDAVIRLIRDGARRQELIEEAVREANKLVDEGLQPARTRLAVLKKDLTRVGKEGQRLVMALTEQGLEENVFARDRLQELEGQRRELRDAVQELEDEIAVMETRHVDMTTIREALERFDDVFDSMTDVEKQEFLALAVKQVIVHPERIEVEVYEGRRLTAQVDDLKRRKARGKGGGGGAVDGGLGKANMPKSQNGRNRWSEDPGFVSGSCWLRRRDSNSRPGG